jgi:hypothetical protein
MSYILVFLWGGMNSWFLYEFRVLSMGSILVNIADNLLKIDYAMLFMVLGSGTLLPAHECHGALVGIVAGTTSWAYQRCGLCQEIVFC